MLTEREARRYLYELIRREVPLAEFESWVYAHPELEELLGAAVYFDMISIDYRNQYAFETVEKLVRSVIDVGAFEQERIVELLQNSWSDQHERVAIAGQIYDEYCNGYTFLRFIALTYIVHADYDELNVYGNREKMPEQQHVLRQEAVRLVGFLNSGEIVITNEYRYVDNRDEKDKMELHSLEQMYK